MYGINKYRSFSPTPDEVLLMIAIQLFIGLPIVLLFALTTIAVMKVAGFNTESQDFNGPRAMLVTALVVLVVSPFVGGMALSAVKQQLVNYATEYIAPMISDSIEERVLEPAQASINEAREQITAVGEQATSAARALTLSLTEGSGAEAVRGAVERVRESEFSDIAARGSELAGDLTEAGTAYAADRLDEAAAEGSGTSRTERAADYLRSRFNNGE